MFSSFFREQASVSPEELHRLLADPPQNVFFIDVRTREEWDEGHIDGFRHIPLDELPKHLTELGRSSAIYMLCRSGGRSARACALMKEAGCTEAINVSGGIQAWVKSGFALTR